MKKLLTLFTLLLTVCSGAWGENENLKADDASGNSYTGTAYNFAATGSITTDKSQATAADDNTLHFNKGWLPSGSSTSSSNYYTFTAKNDISSLKVYYTMSDSKFGTKDQSKSGNFTYKIGDADPVVSTNTDDKSNKTAYVETISNIKKGDVIKLYSSASRLVIFGVYATYTSKTIATQAYAGVKKGSTTLTENTDFTKEGNVITFASSYMTTVAPTDVKLINHITYTDESTKDEDVDVTFGATASAGFFTGTATIALTEYTVKVPYDNTPTIGLSSESESLTLKSYDVIKSVTTTLTGANLTDGVYNVTATGLNISPASFTVTDGAVSQEFTIATTASTTTGDNVINFTAGEQSVAYTLNVTKPAKRSVSQSVVTEATTWDWTKAPVADTDILLTKVGVDDATVSTDPVRGDAFLMATLPEVKNDANFNSQALILNTQYVYRKSSYQCLQGNSVSFKTTASGTYVVRVYFSNTSDRSDTQKNRRYLYINGENTGVYTLDQTFIPAQAVLTLDGTEQTITIDAKTGEDTPAETMVRIRKIEFLDKVPVTISDKKYATFASDYDLDFSNMDDEGLYAYTATVAGNELTFTKVTGSTAAEEGLLLYSATAKTYNVPVATGNPAKVSGNKLVRGTGAAVTSAGEGETKNYVLSTNNEGEVNFYLAAGNTVPTSKAYLKNISTTTTSKFFLPTGDEEGEETDGIKAVSTKVENGVRYNLAGQKVSADYKGIVIVNGKKVIRK